MSGSVRRVLIAGGGISGLTLAIALRRFGLGVDLVEIRHDWDQQIGVGLTLIANALRALETLGLAAACIEVGMPATSINMRRPDATLMHVLPVARIGGEALPGHVSLSRRALHRILAQAAQAAGTRVRLGTSVQAFAESEQGIEVALSDGSHPRYDLLVGAEGVPSGLRARLFPGVQPQLTGQAVWRAPIPRPPDMVTTEMHLGGRHGVVGLCPISETEAYLYVVEKAAGGRLDASRLRELLDARLEGYGGQVQEARRHLPDSAEINYRPLEWLIVPAPWYRDRVVLIGDAAHCNPPVLAQGAAMGIEDAVVLAEELSAGGSLDAALERFMARRYTRVKMVVENSVTLARAEVEQRHDVNVGAVIGETMRALAAPL